MSVPLSQQIATVQAELETLKRELAAFEALLCQCHPQREHGDYARPADYLHAADCVVAGAQQAAAQQ